MSNDLKVMLIFVWLGVLCVICQYPSHINEINIPTGKIAGVYIGYDVNTHQSLKAYDFKDNTNAYIVYIK